MGLRLTFLGALSIVALIDAGGLLDSSIAVRNCSPLGSKQTLTHSATPILRPFPFSTARHAAACPMSVDSIENDTWAIPKEPPVVGHRSISTIETSPYTEKNVMICASVMSGDSRETNTFVNGFGPTEFSSN